MIDFATLITGKSADTIYNEALAAVVAAGTRITNWRTGGPYKTLLSVEARALELLYQLAAAFASGAYLDTAVGVWLTALGADLFQAPRQPSTSATYDVTLTTSAGAGPYTLAPGAVIVSTSSGLKYRAVNPGNLTLPANGSVVVPVKAESPGSRYNVSGAAITGFDAPNLLGVTVTAATSTAAGADEEGDDRYKERLRAKWATLGAAGTENAYRYWALNASPEVTQVAVLSNWHSGVMTPAWVTLLVCGDGATISDAALALVNAALLPPLGYNAEALKATAQAVTLTATAYVPSAYLAEAAGKITTSLEALRRRTPIGGTVYRSQIVDAIHYEPGKVRNVVVTAPTDPITVAYNRYLTWAPTVTLVGV